MWYLNLLAICFNVAMLQQVATSNQTKYCTKHKGLFNMQLNLIFILMILWSVKVLTYAFRLFMTNKKEALA